MFYVTFADRVVKMSKLCSWMVLKELLQQFIQIS